MGLQKPVPIYRLKKDGKFKFIDTLTGQPTENIYVKGRPHTDTWSFPHKQMYVTTIYAPGERYNGTFTGYVDCTTKVYPYSEDDLKPKR